MLAKMGVGESILQSRLATGSTTFVVAYAVHKVFAPVRIAITLTCTPFIVRHLRKIGFLKPPKLN
jgi:predicted aconitase